jgi:DnaJ-class molecular chaperone
MGFWTATMAQVELREDYYEILEVSQSATFDDIEKSYRRLALLLHLTRIRISLMQQLRFSF